MYLILLPWAARLAGAWTFINGILHTGGVILKQKPYDRNLLYLLMIGGILIFSGLTEFVSSWGIKQKDWRMITLCASAAAFVLALCLILIPIFPAIGMIIIHTALLVLLIISIFVKAPAQQVEPAPKLSPREEL